MEVKKIRSNKGRKVKVKNSHGHMECKGNKCRGNLQESNKKAEEEWT